MKHILFDRKRIAAALFFTVLAIPFAACLVAQDFEPFMFAPHPFEENDAFGSSVAVLGDLDDDGTLDYAVGAPGYDMWDVDAGAVWVLRMWGDGNVNRHTILRQDDGSGPPGEPFGSPMGRQLTAFRNTDPATQFNGAVFGIGESLFVYKLESLASRVKASQREFLTKGSIVSNVGNVDGRFDKDVAVSTDEAIKIFFLADISAVDSSTVALKSDYQTESNFGQAIAAAGDLDSDGFLDIAVAADDAVRIFFLNAIGQNQASTRISIEDDVFGGRIQPQDRFGAAIAGVGDIDQDTVPDLLVGAPGAENDAGALWILRMNADGSVKAANVIDNLSAPEASSIEAGDQFGASISTFLEGETAHVIVGAPGTDDGLENAGAVWTFSFDGSSEPQSTRKISNTAGNMVGRNETHIGQLVNVGDIDQDGIDDLMSMLWILFMRNDGTIKAQIRTDEGAPWKVYAEDGSLSGLFRNNYDGLGDFDGDGINDIVTGNPSRVGETATGIHFVDLVFLNKDGSKRNHKRIQPGPDSKIPRPAEWDAPSQWNVNPQFGKSVVNLGDIDGDYITDIAVGTPAGLANFDTQEPGRQFFGSVYVILLNAYGADEPVKDYYIIPPPERGRTQFGIDIEHIGDINNDGITYLLVGARGGLSEVDLPRALWVYRLGSLGQLLGGPTKISYDGVGFPSSLPFSFREITTNRLTAIDDLNGDGYFEVVSSRENSDAAGNELMFFQEDGQVFTVIQFNNETGPTAGLLDDYEYWGESMVSIGDLNGDSFNEVAMYVEDQDDFGRFEEWRSGYFVFQINKDLGLSIIPSSETLIAEPGSEALVSADIRDLNGIGVRSSEVHFRRAGEEDFLKGVMLPDGDDFWSYAIPGWTLSNSGMEYFISAENVDGQVAQQPAEGVYSLPVRLNAGLEYALESGSEENGYRLVSFPLELDSTAAMVILEDDLGPYDPRHWRFVDPQQSQLSPESELFEIFPGQAYWILVRDANRRLTTGPGTTVSTHEPYQIRLQQGWNYVGNPFNFSIPLKNVTVESSTPENIQTYEGSWARVDSVLRPFEGYIVYSGSTAYTWLYIDPDISSASDSRYAKHASIGAGSWAVQIRAQLRGALDEDNYAVASTSASEGWDLLDRPEPPVIGDYVSVSFPHPEWQRNGRSFTSDARSVSSGGATWTFAVKSKKPGPVELTFPGLSEVPEEYSIWLIDDLLQIHRDLRRAPVYVVSSGGQGAERMLMLTVGTDAYLRGELQLEESIPTEFDLFQNFPNPFRGSTTIRYSVPQDSRVRVEIFDILGRRVATLADQSEEAGYHAIVWDGRGDSGATLGNGVYFARMSAGDFQKTLSITLIE